MKQVGPLTNTDELCDHCNKRHEVQHIHVHTSSGTIKIKSCPEVTNEESAFQVHGRERRRR